MIINLSLIFSNIVYMGYQVYSKTPLNYSSFSIESVFFFISPHTNNEFWSNFNHFKVTLYNLCLHFMTQLLGRYWSYLTLSLNWPKLNYISRQKMKLPIKPGHFGFKKSRISQRIYLLWKIEHIWEWNLLFRAHRIYLRQQLRRSVTQSLSGRR